MKCPFCGAQLTTDLYQCNGCREALNAGAGTTSVNSDCKSPNKQKRPLNVDPRLDKWFVLLVILALGAIAPLLLTLIQDDYNRAPSRLTQCKNNVHQLALALHSYHDKHGCFPPAVTYSEDGQPMHSWRVLLLPYLDGTDLLAQYRMDEPWDSVNNSQLLSKMPAVYRCALSHDAQSKGFTSYASVDDPKSVMSSPRGLKLNEITDGTSNTLMLVEVEGLEIPWTQPLDFKYSAGMVPAPGRLWSNHEEGLNALMADGTVRFIENSISPLTLKSLITIDGND